MKTITAVKAFGCCDNELRMKYAFHTSLFALSSLPLQLSIQIFITPVMMIKQQQAQKPRYHHIGNSKTYCFSKQAELSFSWRCCHLQYFGSLSRHMLLELAFESQQRRVNFTTGTKWHVQRFFSAKETCTDFVWILLTVVNGSFIYKIVNAASS